MRKRKESKMAWMHEGRLGGEGLKPAVVVSRFNSVVTERLLDGALDCFERHDVDTDDIDVFRVPGAMEIPALAVRIADTGLYHCVVCLGAVVRGETPHFEQVAAESAKGIAQAGMLTDVPVIYGIVTADTMEQAVDRAGAKAGNRGFDAAMTALEMVSVYGELSLLEDASDEEGTGETG